MGKKIMLLFVILFFLGWISSSVYSNYTNNKNGEYLTYNIIEVSDEDDAGDQDSKVDQNAILKEFERIEQFFEDEKSEERDKISPYDWIKTDQIYVYNDQVIIKLQNPEWAIFTDTNSMDPVIDSTSNAIEIIPKTEDDIHVGDIVAYKSKYKDGIVTHRVIEIGHDISGWYAKIKGDNNDYVDPGKIRFEQIKRVVVAVIY